MREANRYARELTCPSYPIAFVAKALAAIDAGETDQARDALVSAATLLPGWRTEPQSVLGRTIPDAAIVKRILRDLSRAGPTAGPAGSQ